jgi:hypothetical protein
MAVPYIFQNVSGNIPLANLDANFDTPIVLGTTSITLGTTATNLSGFSALSTANLTASGTVSGTGFSNYFASPPALGGAVPNTGAFTSLTSSSTTTLNGTSIPASKTLLVSTDIGTAVQAYSTNLDGWSAVATSAKQNTLVSGTNIKTVNSTSLLGSGDLAVGDVTLTGTQTLSNKTISNLIIDGYIREEVFAVSGTTPALSPSNGTIQTWTLTGNSTPTQGTWTQGESMTLMINDGSAFTVNWTSVPVVWVGGTAPTLATTGFTVIELWEVGTTIYGALVGQVA